MASEPGVSASYKSLPAKSCTACCCGGMPPLIQTLRGEGKAFLNGGGTIAKKELASGETILVDSDAVFAFQDGVGYDVKTVGGCMTCCFGGEGCFNTELTGPGVIYVQVGDGVAATCRTSCCQIIVRRSERASNQRVFFTHLVVLVSSSPFFERVSSSRRRRRT